MDLMKRINYTPLQESYLAFNVLNLRDDMQRNGDPVITQDAITSDIVCTDFLSPTTGCSYETYLDQFLDSNSDGPENALILDLVKTTRDLQEKTKEQKEWAQRKLVDSARRFRKDFMELNLLRREASSEKDKMKDEKLHAEKEHNDGTVFRKVNLDANFVIDSIRADPEALKLNGSESERELKEIRKRKNKWKKNLSDVEKQISNYRSQRDEEKQRAIGPHRYCLLDMFLASTLRKRRRIYRKSTPYIVPFGIILFLPVQFQNDVVLKESTTAYIFMRPSFSGVRFRYDINVQHMKVKWRQEIKAKEDMVALVAGEARMFEIGKANARTGLLRLQQKVELGSHVEMDDCRILQDELLRLRLCQQMAEVQLTENARSSESSATMEYSSERRIGRNTCMMCLQNDVSVVLLPCTHQVFCFPCFERNYSAVGANCPYCNVRIEHSIRLYGPS
ncbi:hypothetical protein MIMGU_mgv1a026762mg [Erythranthe guttata]|uniref:RING-type domain-containing protein n=1 Tax=Erythranthe guttata TaxID=4155 RepID=A0A022QQC5_ERYGU|nr:hypothetical protein MIMGU_mgv1a026762mg [Erythranthe guttata]